MRRPQRKEEGSGEKEEKKSGIKRSPGAFVEKGRGDRWGIRRDGASGGRWGSQNDVSISKRKVCHAGENKAIGDRDWQTGAGREDARS